MSNGGLEQAGLKYSLLLEGVTQNAQIIINNFARIEQSQKKVTDGARTVSQSLDANARSLRLVGSELLNVAGVGGQASGIFAGLLAAAGPLDIFLVTLAGTLGVVKFAYDENAKAIESQTTAVANSISDYETFVELSNKIRNTPQGQINSYPSTVLTSFSGQASVLDSQARVVATDLGGVFGNALALGINQAFGLHRDDLAAGFKADLQAALGRAASDLNPFDFLANAQAAGRRAVAASQARADTEQFVGGAAHRAAAAALSEEINKMAEAGATADQLIPRLYKLAEAQGRVVTGADLQSQASNLVSDAATKAYEDRQAKIEEFNQRIRDVEQEGFEQSEQLAADHGERMAAIEEQAGEQRARIARSLKRQLEDIEATLQDARERAAESRSDALASAEENAQERRVQLAQESAERRAEIEQQFQDAIRSAQENYAESEFEATARGDARALINAKRTKDKAIRDADEQRRRDLENAQKQDAKAQKQLEDALRKQKEQIEKDFQRRLRDAEQQADKQRQRARRDNNDQLNELEASLAKQKAAENKSYADRQRQLDAAEVKRINSIKAAMEKEVGVTRDFLQEIGDSIKSLLNPDRISAAINDLQKQISARVEVFVTPYGREKAGGKKGGGFSGSEGGTSLVPYRGGTSTSTSSANSSGTLNVNLSGKVVVSGDALSSDLQVMVANELADAIERKFGGRR